MSHPTSPERSLPEFGFTLPNHVALVVRDAAGDAPPSPFSEEEALIHPRAVRSRRNDVRHGRAAAHEALRRIGHDGGPILRGDHREPLWPTGTVGSIAHATGLAVAVAAVRKKCGGIGIDLEHIDRHFEGLANTVAFDEEHAWLAPLETHERARATLALFSAKEAIYKAFFPRVQHFFGFEAVRIRPAEPGRLEARFTCAIDPAFDGATPVDVQCRWANDVVATLVVLPPQSPQSSSATE